MVGALAVPAPVFAAAVPAATGTEAGAPSVSELTAAVTATAIAQSKAANALEWAEARIASASVRLEQTADSQTASAIRVELVRLRAERDGLLARLQESRAAATTAMDRLVAVIGAQAASERASRMATFGVFPVSGVVEYVDSWGAPRSGGRSHKGTDIMAASGTPLVAVKDGVVTSGSSRLGGITLWLETTDGTRYYYAHLQSIEIGSGTVVAGQVIGYVGSTGNASTPHLHFEIHRPGAVDPYPELQQMVR
jgi:murein DD-endopeptidase MepM/ murein hydrolase activator NlpD